MRSKDFAKASGLAVVFDLTAHTFYRLSHSLSGAAIRVRCGRGDIKQNGLAPWCGTVSVGSEGFEPPTLCL